MSSARDAYIPIVFFHSFSFQNDGVDIFYHIVCTAFVLQAYNLLSERYTLKARSHILGLLCKTQVYKR